MFDDDDEFMGKPISDVGSAIKYELRQCNDDLTKIIQDSYVPNFSYMKN